MEEWVDIRGYEGYYQVSNMGGVRSLDVKRWNGCGWFIKRGRVLKSRLTKHGYCRVQLNGKDKYVHRLVAEHFIDNPNNKPEVDHIDGDKSNNCVDNLRWVTGKENMNNPLTREKLDTYAKKRVGVTINNKKVNQILDGVVINTFNSITEASEFIGIDNSTLGKIIKHKIKNNTGYEWEVVQ